MPASAHPVVKIRNDDAAAAITTASKGAQDEPWDVQRYREQKARAMDYEAAQRAGEASDKAASDKAARDAAEASFQRYQRQKAFAAELAQAASVGDGVDGAKEAPAVGEEEEEEEPPAMAPAPVPSPAVEQPSAPTAAKEQGSRPDDASTVGDDAEAASFTARPAAKAKRPKAAGPPPAPLSAADRHAAARALAQAAEEALARAPLPSKAAFFVSRDSLSALLNDDLVDTAQVACGREARLKLSGKKRLHVAISAVDECALDRSLVALLVILSQRSELVAVEIRWQLKSPALTPDAILKRWHDAAVACQGAYPVKGLDVTLTPDQSCVKLTLLSDGWEEWNEHSARLAPGATSAFVLAWLLCNVRYNRWPRLQHVPLDVEQERELRLEHPARLRSLSAQTGALAILLRTGPALLLCGPRTAVGKARTLLRAWDEAA